jgi:hypothetical protein
MLPIAFGVFGGLAGFLLGLITSLLTALAAAMLGLLSTSERWYRWITCPLGATVCLIVVRLIMAQVEYVTGDFHYYGLGWDQENFPRFETFILVIVIPTLLAGLGGW